MRTATSTRFEGLRRAMTAGVVVLGLAASDGLRAQAQDVEMLEQQVNALEGELGRVTRAYDRDYDLANAETFEERLSQGELFFVSPDMYEQAATVLYGVVLPQNSSRIGYDDGLYMLAESLYQLGNLGIARKYFSELLARSGHSKHTLAIQRLMAIAERLRDWAQVDAYYQAFQSAAGGQLPSEVRYLYAKSLFLARRDERAHDELAAIPVGDAYHLRAQYLIGALHTRAADLEQALADFEKMAGVTPVAPEDKKVLELSYIARGRLLYELDRLTEAVDAYQYVQWSSDYLTTMLYEVTWTYVRRAQLTMRNEELSESDRTEKALGDYELALDQLEDLRLLEPDSTRAADFTLLAGSLRLQRGEYDEAQDVFEEVLARYGAADAKLGDIMKDAVKRERIIQDILAMEGGALSIESEMPPVAARRAADNDEVANAVRVFRDIDTSRAEIDAAEKMLAKLEGLLTSDTRAELFPNLREALSKAYGVENEILAARSRLAELLHEVAAKEGAKASPELEEVRQRRQELARKVASMPKSGEALTERKERFDAGYERLEQDLHKVSIEVQGLRAQLTAVDMLYNQQQGSGEAPAGEVEKSRRRIQEFLAIVTSMEEERDRIRRELEEAQLTTTMSGGRGASEAGLRVAYARTLDEEQELLRAVGTTPRLERIRQADARARRLSDENMAFLARLNSVVDRHVGQMRQSLDQERENLRIAAAELDQVNVAARDIRDIATTVAIDHVRAEVHDIVVRGDVGLIDTAFARKQRETEKIGRLQRQRAAELTDLNQAYADLTADDSVD